MKLPPPSVKRVTIEGPVILKRKTQWVRRFARIDKCIFSYKNAPSDKKDKLRVDLR